MTRSRAKTLAATGQTPALGALPDKTPATTRATTRRRAAAAAAAPSETEGGVAPVVLFDVTNEQTGSPAQPPLTARDAPVAVQQPAAAAAPVSAPSPAAEPAAPAEEPSLPSSPAPAAAAAEEPAVPASPAPIAAADDPVAEEPPATPATATTSPAPPVPGATPTGLGLSTLLPLSPSPPLAFQVQAATPAATPLAGLHADHQTKVADALAAAVEALGGASPAAASPAPAAGLGGEPMFRGFGSPLKQEEEGGSPALLPAVPAASAGPCVSIGAAIGAADAAVADDAMSSPAPEVGLEADFERELTLEEMMGTPPGASDREDTPVAAAAAPAATPGVLVRTAAKVHPLTPARQVVLEEEEQDYIMQTEEDVEDVAAAAAAPSPAPAAQPSPAPSTIPGLSPAVLYLAPSAAASPAPALAAGVPAPSPAPAAEAAAEEAAQPPQARVSSKVVLPSPGVYDPRSLRQLKREVADRLAAKQAVAPHLFSEDEDVEGDGEYIGTPSGDDLAEELGALSLEGGNKLLRGLPTPAGTHIRFDEEGDVAAISPRQRVFLRGMPQPAGTHIKFDD
ncbi:hypothetical protein COHA_001831 [Chlorella ohadii]|uniref:Uncharacterized protein n=1 Tax=Chlorella ohadii TaxID=2649997 RepID=A0AAD5DYH9_9CHLO|nr:hypothetical protein COHA_001831 [Chlorella ohadii]